MADHLMRSKDYAYGLPRVLDWVRSGKPQAAPDSGKAHYSDTNFQLLGAVIEAATGLSFGEALQERICKPLGLSRTALFEPNRDGDGRTQPVRHEAPRLEVPLILSSMGPDGGIVSDTGELMTFLRAFMAGQPSPELIGHSGASESFANHAPGPAIILVGTFNRTDASKRPFGFMLEVLKAVAAHEGLA